MKKAVKHTVSKIINALPPHGDVTAMGEALGYVSATLLTEVSDEDFEIWVTAVRDTRKYLLIKAGVQRSN